MTRHTKWSNQTEPMILVSLVTVTCNDAIIIIHHLLKGSNTYLIIILQTPIKHKKRTDHIFLPNVADTVQLPAFPSSNSSIQNPI